MGKIYLSSDLHFEHDREFIWGAREYSSVDEMNKEQLRKYNEIITDEDDVYLLGDLMLGDAEAGKEFLSQLKGKIHVIIGNHDTSTRIKIYESFGWDVQYATVIKYKKHQFYLSHYPTLTANFDVESLRQAVINMFGHTHQTTNFYQDIPFMYHVGVDSHNGYPVLLDDAIEEMYAKVDECKKLL
jgi:calcineurin-like phosphoesterase family protein